MRVRAQWDEECSLAETVSILRDLSLRHCRLAGSEGEKISRLITDGDFRSLCDYKIDYAPGLCPQALYHLRQALAFWQKLEPLEIGVDKEQVAFSKFVESELLCLRTNEVFGSHLAGGLHFLPRDSSILYRARRKIASILGPVPALQDLGIRFGPGATTNVKRSHACPQSKLSSRITCSYDLYTSGRLSQSLREVPHWTSTQPESTWYVDSDGWLCESFPVEISAGKLEFVPKNARTYRSIVVEPGLNSMFQLGIGDWMAVRLRANGIDIHDQSRNASLARVASITGGFATLDLSSASDTIASELVRFLLPPEWFALLGAFRTREVCYRHQSFNLQKFSSMGNGFTFPLETLIFWALTWAVCRTSEIGVYGDDIICPTEKSDEVIRILELCGFSVNTEKSFTHGPFRESCGHDYYLGFDIRPYYQKHLVSGMSLFTLYNFYFRQHDDDGCRIVLGFIPSSLQIFGPDGYGDGHLLKNDYPRRYPSKLLKKGYGGHLFDTFRLESLRQTPRYPGDYVSPLYSIYTSGDEVCPVTGIGIKPDSVRRSKSGFPLWTLPGHKGYKRVSIYSLSL